MTLESAVLADEQSRATIRTDIGRTLFVEAGAGSGKTTALVDRIITLVLKAPDGQRVPLSAIAAITFTEAAAAELRERVRARFEVEKRDAEASGDLAMVGRCAQALQDADIAAISTLHSFAQRLLAEFPVEVGIPPRVEVLDEVQSQVAFDDRWSDFVDELFDDRDVAEFIVRATLLNVRLGSRRSPLRDVAKMFDDNWDRLLAVAPGPTTAAPIIWDRVRPAMRELRGTIALCSDSSDKLASHLSRLFDVLDRFDAADVDIERLRILLEIADFRRGSGGTKGAWGSTETVGEVKDCISALAEVAAELKGEVADQTLGLFATRIAKFTVEAAQVRRAEGRLEFHDLLVLARTLLRESPEARTGLSDRYQVLMLDEFQDTDPIQIELALLLADPRPLGPSHKWEDLQPDPGRVFMVGDPKQSIYRFRRADISLFLKARGIFSDGSAVLTQNFRTVTPVIDMVNAFFSDVMPETTAYQAAYIPLTAVREPSSADHRPLILDHEEHCSAGELRTIEASLVAQTIDTIRRNPDDWLIEEEDAAGQSSWRQPELADITILLPTRTSLPQLTAALDGKAIDYRADTGSLVYETQEIRELLAVLRAVDDPSDQIALVAALRSPLYGCGDDDLWRFKRAGGAWDFRRTVPPEVEGTRVAQSIEHLRSLADRRWWDEPSALLSRVVEERHALAIAAYGPRSRDSWRRIRYLIDQARAFAEAEGGDLRSYLRWASLQGLDGSKAHEPMLNEPDLDAVRIMTVHGSKGLEFPITIVSGLTTKQGTRRAGAAVSWNDDGELPDVKIRKDLSTGNFDRNADLEGEMDDQEKQRLLYVALTRARDHLIVSGVANVDKKGNRVPSFGQAVHDFAEARGAGGVRLLSEQQQQGALLFAAPKQVATTPDDPYDADWSARRASAISAAAAPRVRSATAIAAAAQLAARQSSPGEGQYISDEEFMPEEDVTPWGEMESEDPLPPRTFRRGRAGTAIGSAVHAVLQLLDLSDPQSAEIESLCVAQAWAESVPEHLDTIREAVGALLGTEIVMACRELNHWKEVFVAAPLGDITVEGYVDLLVERPDGLVVVDYKTDVVDSSAQVDAKVERYALQGAAYAAAIEQATGRPVVDVQFVFAGGSGIGAAVRSVVDLPRRIGAVRSIEHLDSAH